ncbi:esterase/lipase family protein [Streptomyces xiamenensis]|uniref:esterase/lipase family protein n=1 Tax=Streptomyces xiamenensis TaxID=408015 RepID=UPI0035E108C9
MTPPDSDRVGLVFVHGFRSGPEAWESFVSLIEQDQDLSGVETLLFRYASPALPPLPWRRVPSTDDAAGTLHSALENEAGRYRSLILVGHSHGGLVIQRYLSWMLREGRAPELAAISQVVLFACPNDGSQFAQSWRRSWMGWNPQERQLRTLDSAVKETQRIVLRGVVYAQDITATSCPVPVAVYAGDSDQIVTATSARSVFPDAGTLSGGHSGIIRPQDDDDESYRTLKRLVLRHTPASIGAAESPRIPRRVIGSRSRRPRRRARRLTALSAAAVMLLTAGWFLLPRADADDQPTPDTRGGLVDMSPDAPGALEPAPDGPDTVQECRTPLGDIQRQIFIVPCTERSSDGVLISSEIQAMEPGGIAGELTVWVWLMRVDQDAIKQRRYDLIRDESTVEACRFGLSNDSDVVRCERLIVPDQEGRYVAVTAVGEQYAPLPRSWSDPGFSGTSGRGVDWPAP